MSCTGRPRIPPALFTRSSHHSVERSPAAPTGAAIPARIVSTPIFTGPPACANTGAASRRTVAAAAPAPMSLSKLRRVVLMASSLRVRASFPAAFYHTSARAWLGEVVEAEIEPVQVGGSMIVVDFAMQVRFWGTRGSIATPGATTAVYGGNTSCTEVRAADGTVIVLDCGTGVRGLGLHLVRTMPQPMRLHLFIGHTHWDHIQGFPFFIAAFLPGAELNLYAPRGFHRSLEEAMSVQMEYSYFPVKRRELRSRIHYTELDEGLFRVGEVRVETQYLNHTGPTIGYRLSSGGATLAYMTDHEPFWSLPGRVSQHPGDERHIAFMRGADLVIHDAEVAAIEEVLGEDALVLLRLADVPSVLRRGSDLRPDLAIIDRALLDSEGAGALDTLRARLGRANFPVVVLADGSVAADVVGRGEASSTDYLARPFSPPMLRARVRAWLSRTLTAFDGPRGTRPRPAEGADREAGRARYAGLLTSVPLFRSLTNEQRELLVARASEEVFPAGHSIIQESDPADSLFVILSGRARVLEEAAGNPGEVILSELGEGEIVGELAIIRNRARSSTVLAVERTHCLLLHQDDFLQVLETSVGLAVAPLPMMAGRLYETDRRLSRYAPDPVTGLASRRAFLDQYRRLAAVARRRGTGALMLVLDVIHLRAINDRFGYGVGDDVLRAVADALIEATRTTDLVARHGSDEFAIFFPDAGPDAVDLVVARVRDKIAQLAAKRGLPVDHIRCNVGVAYSQSPPETPEELLREADQVMHQAKS